jgi:hypothetical protein
MNAEPSSLLAQDLQIEAALLSLIVSLHPSHLTAEELVREMVADPRDEAEGNAVRNAIGSLCRSGLVREIGETIAPTHAALRLVSIFEL